LNNIPIFYHMQPQSDNTIYLGMRGENDNGYIMSGLKYVRTFVFYIILLLLGMHIIIIRRRCAYVV